MKTILDQMTDTWKVTPFLVPEHEDDPQGVYKVEPAFSKLNKAYENAPFCQDDTTELDAVHTDNLAIARLIEATPSLLKACKNALEDLEKLNAGHATIEDVCGIIPELRAAINQAQSNP